MDNLKFFKIYDSCYFQASHDHLYILEYLPNRDNNLLLIFSLGEDTPSEHWQVRGEIHISLRKCRWTMFSHVFFLRVFSLFEPPGGVCLPPLDIPRWHVQLDRVYTYKMHFTYNKLPWLGNRKPLPTPSNLVNQLDGLTIHALVFALE